MADITIVVEKATGQFPGYFVNAVKKGSGKFGVKEIINIRPFLCPPGVGQSASQYGSDLDRKLDDANEFACLMARIFDTKVETL